MIPFEVLVETIIRMRKEHRPFSDAAAWCRIQGMDYVNYDFDSDTYKKEGYGTVVITKNSKGEVKGIRAWKSGADGYIINTIPFK